MKPPDTKALILDAAEELFAENGYHATSMRLITTRADVNVAAIHYHFGGKAELLAAVFDRRLFEVNAERLAQLDALEAQYPDGTPLRELLVTFLEPPIRRLASGDSGWERFTRLFGRVLGESGDHFATLHEVFREIHRRYFPAFQRALPHLDHTDLTWRLHFLIGAMSHLLSDPDRLNAMSRGSINPRESEATLAQLVAFAEGAFAAPAAMPRAAGAPAPAHPFDGGQA